MAVESKVPYVASYGNITKVLEKIQKAATPDKFSQDYLAKTLNMSGGGSRPVIPFLKRTGFLRPDGSPTELYERFRNDKGSGAAAAEALKAGFSALYGVNENIHNADDAELKGVIVQVTGAKKNSSTVGQILGSFKALRGFADFTAAPADTKADDPVDVTPPSEEAGGLPNGLSLGYTINLHLPSTSDIAVFNAIFKSLKENLLRS